MADRYIVSIRHSMRQIPIYIASDGLSLSKNESGEPLGDQTNISVQLYLDTDTQGVEEIDWTLGVMGENRSGIMIII